MIFQKNNYQFIVAKNFLLALIILLSYSMSSQNMDDFKKDILLASQDMTFNGENLDEILHLYGKFLTPHSDTTQLITKLKGQEVNDVFLYEFKKSVDYKLVIEKLINSENKNHRLLSYLLIASTVDKSKEKTLLTKLKSETSKNNSAWIVMALMHLKSNHTSVFFDFLVENENFSDAHMLPMYFRLNPDSLRVTAYNRIDNDNIKAKILAIQSLSKTGNNPKTEKIILDAINSWDFKIKGYAIFSAKEIEAGNLKKLLTPFIDSSKTRRVALQALVNSRTKEDVEFVKQLTINKKEISKDVLDAFLESGKTENTEYWLKLLSNNNMPEKYYFNTFKKPYLFSDSLLSAVQNTLVKTKHVDVQKNLIKVLQGRNDEKSISIFLKYLENDNEHVRYSTAEALKETKHEAILKKLIKLLSDPKNRVSPITKILIKNNKDTLQPLYRSIIKSSLNSIWRNNAIEYLSAFPQKKDKKIFKEIINTQNSDYVPNRYAAIGLGNLKVRSEIDRIIELSNEERVKADSNSYSYIKALSKLKGKKSKKHIESFLNSENQGIKKLSAQILEDW